MILAFLQLPVTDIVKAETSANTLVWWKNTVSLLSEPHKSGLKKFTGGQKKLTLTQRCWLEGILGAELPILLPNVLM